MRINEGDIARTTENIRTAKGDLLETGYQFIVDYNGGDGLVLEVNNKHSHNFKEKQLSLVCRAEDRPSYVLGKQIDEQIEVDIFY